MLQFLASVRRDFGRRVSSGLGGALLWIAVTMIVVSCAGHSTQDDVTSRRPEVLTELDDGQPTWDGFEDANVLASMDRFDVRDSSSLETQATREEPVEESLPQIVERLQDQLLQHWEGAPADADVQELARRIIALSYLGADQGATLEPLNAAAQALQESAREEDQILAALGLGKLGHTEEAQDILRNLIGARPEPSSVEEPSTTAEPAEAIAPPSPIESALEPAPIPIEPTALPSGDDFTLASVVFASKIDGPGEFETIPREKITRGKDVLVYGEFHNFQVTSEQDDPSDREMYARSFRGTLQLTDANGVVLDELEFLPEGRGRQVVDEPSEPVNFWARDPIPTGLESGNYRIRIAATDLISGRNAEAMLEFDVK